MSSRARQYISRLLLFFFLCENGLYWVMEDGEYTPLSSKLEILDMDSIGGLGVVEAHRRLV